MTPIERFWKEKHSEKYDTYLLGMSHSVNGIIEELLPGKVYKFSAPSMDLYYQRLVLLELEEKGALSHCKTILLEMPYYIFNYDASMCKNVMSIRLEEYGYFDDYHHYQGPKYEPTVQDYVAPSILYRSVFQKPYVALRLALKKKELHFWGKEELDAIKALSPHVWYKDYPETFEENQAIWKDIVEIIRRNEVDLRVLVLPFHPFFLKSHEAVIETKKAQFYKVLGNISVLDYMDEFRDGAQLFDDECHLNSAGARVFTKQIKRNLK